MRRLTLVAAPAGFGKTTLLAAWMVSADRPMAWLSVDEADDGRRPLLRSLTAALRTIDPEFGAATLSLLELPELPGPIYQAQILASDLDEIGRELAIVLDDYHLIHDPTVQELVGHLLRYLPEQVHLVLAGRDDPPLALARLRARDELTELRAEELRFDPDEAQAFLESALGRDVEAEVLSELVERTEGWAAGLRLGSLSLRDATDQLERARNFRGDQRHLRTFFADEVLDRQDAEVREFLLATAILERVCASLGAALLEHAIGVGASQAMLDRITQANLFVVALDHEGTWYRFDRLLRDALTSRLQTEYGDAHVQALHLRASGWFTAHGMFKEAVHHALAGGNGEAAAQVVEAHVHDLLDREEWPLLDACLQALPTELVERRPRLLLARAWVLQVRMAFPAIPALLVEVEKLLPAAASGDLSSARAEVDALWSLVYAIRGELQLAQECGWRALQALPENYRLARRNAATGWSSAMQMLGEGESAISWLRSQSDGHIHDPHGEGLQLAAVAGLVSLMRGDLDALEQLLRSLTVQAERTGLTTTAGWGHYLLARMHYLRNELDQAREHFGAALGGRSRANGLVLRESLGGLALCQQALGLPDAARGTLGVAEGIAAETPGFDPQNSIGSVKWRLALLRGEQVDVPRGVRPGEGESILTLTSLSVECPTLTRAQALLAIGDRASVAEAATLVDWLVAKFEELHEPARLTAALALRALVRHAQADITAGLDDLKRAVELAHPSGLVRPFVELGPPLAGLLAELIGRLPPPERVYPSRLLEAFPRPTGPSETVLPSRHQAGPDLVERLTWRESEVLELLAGRMTNKEIAQTLTISAETVKKHVGNLCQKFQVTNRREVVVRARVLGLLPLKH